MAGHAHAHLFTNRDDRIQEILEVFKQLILIHALVKLHHALQLCQTCRLPAGHGEAVGVFRGAAHDLHGGHISQLFLVVIETVRPVLRDLPRQICAQPVKHRHEVVDDHLDAILGQIADAGLVVLDILVARGQSEFDILMHIDALDDFALKPRSMNLFDVAADFILFPRLACRLVVQHTHEPRAARNLLDLLERDLVAVAAIPAKCHFHTHISFSVKPYAKSYMYYTIFPPVRHPLLAFSKHKIFASSPLHLRFVRNRIASCGTPCSDFVKIR